MIDVQFYCLRQRECSEHWWW